MCDSVKLYVYILFLIRNAATFLSPLHLGPPTSSAARGSPRPPPPPPPLLRPTPWAPARSQSRPGGEREITFTMPGLLEGAASVLEKSFSDPLRSSIAGSARSVATTAASPPGWGQSWSWARSRRGSGSGMSRSEEGETGEKSRYGILNYSIFYRKNKPCAMCFLIGVLSF